MKSKGIVRNAVTSNLPLELSYREPVVSSQAETDHDTGCRYISCMTASCTNPGLSSLSSCACKWEKVR
jgi:hypothetical protein